jgi:hypothetical protein
MRHSKFCSNYCQERYSPSRIFMFLADKEKYFVVINHWGNWSVIFAPIIFFKRLRGRNIQENTNSLKSIRSAQDVMIAMTISVSYFLLLFFLLFLSNVVTLCSYDLLVVQPKSRKIRIRWCHAMNSGSESLSQSLRKSRESKLTLKSLSRWEDHE